MIELPEAVVLARQCNQSILHKRISGVTVAGSPHRFAWYFGEPQSYLGLLQGQVIAEAVSYGGHVEIPAGDARMAFSDGVNLRYLGPGERPPAKHQLLLELADGSCLVASVQMYGGLMAFPAGANDNRYYLLAREKPSPLTGAFDEAYFDALFRGDTAGLSLKAFLATEQRIPGLGNGVLQDILFSAGMHPKKKVGSVSDADRGRLFQAVKLTLAAMVAQGGRDTETGLDGNAGGYRTRLSRNTAAQPCAVCGTPISREAYMGGSIYYCAVCQER